MDEELEKDVRMIIWCPYLSHAEKTERILQVINRVYYQAYTQGRDDTKKVIMQELENI